MKIVPFHKAKLNGKTEKIYDGIGYELSGNRRIEVWKVGSGGFAVRIFRPTVDGKTSKLKFGLSEEAAQALSFALVRQLSASNLNTVATDTAQRETQ